MMTTKTRRMLAYLEMLAPVHPQFAGLPMREPERTCLHGIAPPDTCSVRCVCGETCHRHDGAAECSDFVAQGGEG